MSRELKYGVIAGGATVIWMTLGYLLGWEQSTMGKYAPYLSLMILALAIYITILFKRDRDKNGLLSFKEAFIAGMAVSFVVGLMVGGYLMLYVQAIHPGYADEMVKSAKEYYESQKFSQEQIDKGIESTKAMYSPFGQFTYGIGTTMLVGVFISVIVGALMQRKEKVIGGRS